ncbi:regulatory protein spx [Enterococcus sp. AZ071]
MVYLQAERGVTDMITLYIASYCDSCKKARSWLLENRIPFEERNIINNPLTSEELKELLSKTENGTEDIISIRSKSYRELNIDFEDLSFNELIKLLEDYPDLLKHPIMFDENKLQLGYNKEGIQQFVPRKVRRATEKVFLTILLNDENLNRGSLDLFKEEKTM